MIHDNACPQMAVVTTEGFNQFESEVHTPHGLDLAPSNYQLFMPLNATL
jgi:hypothetical protein